MCSGLWILQSKILRPELRDALCFMRRYAPLKHEPCVSHAAIVPFRLIGQKVCVAFLN